MPRPARRTPHAGGRPPLPPESRLSEALLVRMSAAERAALEALAEADGVTMGRALVSRAVAEAVRRGLVTENPKRLRAVAK